MRIVISFLVGLLIVSSANADEPALDDLLEQFEATETPVSDESIDDLLQGFDDGTAITETTFEQEKEKAWNVDGFVELAAAYNYAHDRPEPGDADHRGLSRLSGKLNLEFDYRFNNNAKLFTEGIAYYNGAYALQGRSQYTETFLDTYESEVELQEAYFSTRLSKHADFTIGRKTVVWGTSDNIRLTDKINPLDERQPGIVDIEDLRLPVGMTQLQYAKGAWNHSLAAILEVRYPKTPVPGSDFFPGPDAAKLPPEEPDEGLSFDHTQWALSATGRFSGWDIAVYAASLLDNRSFLENNIRKHKRFNMLGMAYNGAFGPWLLKFEVAGLGGLRYSATPDTKNKAEALLGVDYQGIGDTTISVEVAGRHIFDFEPLMSDSPDFARQDEKQIAFRFVHDMWNDTLHFTYLGTLFYEKSLEGGFHRFSAEYDINDAMDVTVGVIDYMGGRNTFFEAIQENDRVFGNIRFYF